MSFVVVKLLKCCFCPIARSIDQEDFPEDLYDMIVHYNIGQQLLWACKSCRNDIGKKNFSSDSPCVKTEKVVDKNIEQFEIFSKIKQEDVSQFKNQKSSISDQYDSCNKIYSKLDSSRSSESVCSTSSPSSSQKSISRNARKYCQEILNEIKITPQEDAVNKKIIMSVLDILTNELKKDEIFSTIYNKNYYTGSAYNDLRIVEATEYDIDMVLQLPSCVTLEPDFFDDSFAFGKLKWEASPATKSLVTKFLESISCGNYIQPISLLSWLQKLIDLALNQITNYPEAVKKITTSSSGPARTIVIETDAGFSISIDLVPVFEFEYIRLLKTPIYDEIMKRSSGDKNIDKWFMVPKSCQGEIEDILLSDSRLSWRLDFPNAEKQILQGKQCAKNVIRILKIFRDSKQWKKLASHYLKMVVIWEIKKNPSQEHWQNGFVFERLIDALKNLEKYLADKHLPHFLSNQNLIFKFDPSECTNYRNVLRKVISGIESNPEKLVFHVTSKQESCRN